MRLRRSAAAALVAALLVVSTGRPAAAGAWSLAPGEWSADITGTSFSSATEHDADGNRISLSAPGLFETRTGRARVELGWKKRVSVQMAMPFTSATRTHADGSVAQTSTGLGDFDFGLRYNLSNSASALAVQLGWSAPLGYNRALQPNPGSGRSPASPQGLQSLSAGLAWGAPLGGAGFIEATGGYQYRYRTIGGRAKEASSPTSADVAKRTWADHVTASAAMALWLGERVQLAGLYDGRLAVDQGDRHPEISEHLVGPRLTVRVDDRLDAYAGSWHTAAAEHSLHVNEFYCGLSFRQTKLKRNQGFLGGTAR